MIGDKFIVKNVSDSSFIHVGDVLEEVDSKGHARRVFDVIRADGNYDNTRVLLSTEDLNTIAEPLKDRGNRSHLSLPRPIYQEIKVVEEEDAKRYEQKVEELTKQGYRIDSTACGFLNSDELNFCGCFQAILIRG